MSETPVVLSYGLGVDSTAILLRWINEPSSRDFDLSDLTVITAMTGDEWEQSGQLVTDHILPLFREHGIRYIQIARGGPVKSFGVTILDDSRSPEVLHLKGDYKLSDELITNATVPQVGGTRKCSIKAKGEPLDKVIADTLGADTKFRHVMGFEANEPKRAERDAEEGDSDVRTGEYPLIEWGWDRAKCEEYIKGITGTDWLKSACVFCPFALTNKDGRGRVLDLYRQYPEQAVQALFMEHISLLFNEKQSLTPKDSLVDLIAQDGNQAALDALQERLLATPHALYRVRRVSQARKDGGLNWARSIQRISEPELLAEVDTLTEVIRERDEHTEEFIVLAPAVVNDKQNKNFEAWWEAALAA